MAHSAASTLQALICSKDFTDILMQSPKDCLTPLLKLSSSPDNDTRMKVCAYSKCVWYVFV